MVNDELKKDAILHLIHGLSTLIDEAKECEEALDSEDKNNNANSGSE